MSDRIKEIESKISQAKLKVLQDAETDIKRFCQIYRSGQKAKTEETMSSASNLVIWSMQATTSRCSKAATPDDHIAATRDRISQSKIKLEAQLESKKNKDRVSLVIEILNLRKSSSIFDNDRADAIQEDLIENPYFKRDLNKEEILSDSILYAQKREILRNEGIPVNDEYQQFPELYPKHSSDDEIKVAKLHRSVIAERNKQNNDEKYISSLDITQKRIICESKKNVKCFKTMSDLFILRNILTEEEKVRKKEMDELIEEAAALGIDQGLDNN